MDNSFDRKAHWQKIYTEKDTTQVSWYQALPQTSLDWISKVKLPTESPIIDVGAGDSRLPDALLNDGYRDITVLDISAKALENSQQRLGEKAGQIKWVASDVLDFNHDSQFELWHDRAAFHFLRESSDIQAYVEIAEKHIKPNGHLIIATFSDAGPLKCSGLEIQQYSEEQLEETFAKGFDLLESQRILHGTPSGGSQEFLFALLERKA